MGEPASKLKRLTWDEICDRYPEQWVVLAQVRWAGMVRGQRVVSGLLVSHGTEDQSWDHAKEMLATFGELVHAQTHRIEVMKGRPRACPCPGS